MMNRRRFMYGTAAAAAALAPKLARGDAQMVAKLATVAPDGTPWGDQLKRFRSRVEKATQGRVKISAYMGGALGDENLTASETKRGSVQIWGGSTAALSTLVPELALFELPYLFRNGQEADHVIDKVLKDDLNKILAKRGFQILFWAENGFRSFGTTFGPVTTPDSLRGKKLRSQENDVHIAMYRALGAYPVPIAVTEVLSSLQTRVVDGFDQTPLFTFAASWYQGIKHFTLSEHIYQPAIVVANKPWFDKLSPQDREILRADADAEAVRGRRDVRELGPLLIENFSGAKVTVHKISDAQREEFVKACEPVHNKWITGRGKAAAPLYKRARVALNALRAGNLDTATPSQK